MRTIDLLDGMRTLAKERRRARFTGGIAFAVNSLCIRTCDCLSACLQGMGEAELVHRHGETLQIMDILLELCASPQVLARWRYSAEQIAWFVERIGPAVGAGRAPDAKACEATEEDVERARALGSAVGPGVREACSGVEQTPFLVPLLCAMISPTYKLLPLARMLGRASRGRWCKGDTMFVVQADAESACALGPLWQVTTQPLADLGRVKVVARGASVQWVELEVAWPRTGRPSCSNFLPAKCRIALLGLEAPYNHMLKVPDKDIAYLNKGLEAWERRLGPIAAELRAVLEGTYVVSRTGQPYRPMFMKNHPSLTEDGAMDKLWPGVAKCVWKGIFEFVGRKDPLPRVIVACAAVEKATDPFKRLVTDYRPTNIYVDPWAVKYISIRSIGLVMRRNALWWTRDLAGAYFNGVLGGCGRLARMVTRYRLARDKRSYEPMESKQFGCGPGCCGQFCDKALGAICLEGAVFRIAAAQFGGKTSNGPLALLVDGFYKIMKSLYPEIDGDGFVDDLFFFISTLWHGECVGLEGGCAQCAEREKEGEVYVAAVDALLEELHLERSDKDGKLGQLGTFLGIIMDSHRGRINLTKAKYDKLMFDLLSVLTWDEATPRKASKVRGKLQSYSECIEGVKPFSVPFTVFIGPAKTVCEWDTSSRAVEGMKEAARYLLTYLPSAVPAGAPLWKLEACTLAELVDRGVDVGMKVVIMKCDAAIPGVGMAYRIGNGPIRKCRGKQYSGLSAVMTFALARAAAGGTEEQVWREGWGMDMSVGLALEDEEVKDCVMIVVNDCVPALRALERGSSRSPQLQEAAVSVHKRGNHRGVRLMFLHVSGKQLVAEGIDDGSRKFAAALRGPACGAGLREVIGRFALRAGSAITIDYFAAAANTLAVRYAAWTEDPGAELVDAFTSRSWDQGKCPCGRYHRETGFFFPPNGLEERVVRRAKSDGARGIFLVPINRKAAYYMCLQQYSVEQEAVGMGDRVFEHAVRQMPKMMLFAVDFADGNADRASPPCGQEFVRRADGREVRAVDQEVQSAISGLLGALAESVLAGRV